MNTLILNRDGFQMPADGWYQIAPIGEFAHAQAGVVQVVDVEACEAMVNRFRAEAKGINFAGLLVDFDHFSLDGEKRSEAAGWITDLDNRDGGLFAKIRWSDLGEEAVKGGRYRFLSPVWARSDCIDLGPSTSSGQVRRVRPVRLLNAAVTNDPNLKGMRPLSNRGDGSEFEQKVTKETEGGALRNDASQAPRFKWVLGDSPRGHCPSCAALAGQVRTMAEWQGLGAAPGTGGLYCQGNCHCSLEPTEEPAAGDLNEVPVRKGGWRLVNSENCRLKIRESSDPEDAAAVDLLVNTGWTDAARAASLAARRAKAAKRKGQKAETDDDGEGDGEKQEDVDYAEWFREEGMGAMSEEDIAAFTEQLRQKLAAGEALDYVEEGFLEERVDGGYAGDSDGDPIYQWAERKAEREDQVFEATGMDARDARGKAADLEFRKQQGEKLSAEDESFLKTYNGVMSNRAPEPEARCPTPSAPEAGVLANEWSDAARAAALAVRRAKAGALRPLRDRGDTLVLTGDGQIYLPGMPAGSSDRFTPEPGGSKPVPGSDDDGSGAGAAASAVRRAKSQARDDPFRQAQPALPADDGMMHPGGTPDFDEKTGKYKGVPVPPPARQGGPRRRPRPGWAPVRM